MKSTSGRRVRKRKAAVISNDPPKSTIKERRAEVKRLLLAATAEGDQRILALLTGPIPQARPLGRTVNGSKRRELLLVAWSQSLERLLAEPDPDEAAALARWISVQLPRLSKVAPADALALIGLAVRLSVRLTTTEAGSPAASAVLNILTAAEEWLPDLDVAVAELLTGMDEPISGRSRIASDLGPSVLEQTLLRALRIDADFAQHLLGSVKDSTAKARILTDAVALFENLEVVETVMFRVLSRLDDTEAASFLRPMLTICLKRDSISPTMTQALVDVAMNVPQGAEDPLVSIFARLNQAFAAERIRELASQKGELEEVIEEGRKREVAAAKEIKRLEELLDSLKRTSREPEKEIALRVRSATLKPVCMVWQDMMLVHAEQPEIRLATLADSLKTVLLRQALRMYGTRGEVDEFDPGRHEFASWLSPSPGKVKILVPGFAIQHEVGVSDEVLSKAIVESI